MSELNNRRVFEYMSILLNCAPGFVTKDMMSDMGGGELSYAALLAAVCMLDTNNNAADKELYRGYFIPMMHCLDASDFEKDAYYTNIKLPTVKEDKWEFKTMKCRAYEAFVCGDPLTMPDGRIVPQIGYFERDFYYPAVLEDGREWMTLLPNETITTLPHVKAAFGKVLTFGLGLGYFAYMASEKPEVSSVTVVERDASVIALFEKYLLPQMKNRDKINIINADAFEYAASHFGSDSYDFIFTDIWHDPSDGCELYNRMKALEYLSPSSVFAYWLEDTIKLYL